jgi:hypothetical protein
MDTFIIVRAFYLYKDRQKDVAQPEVIAPATAISSRPDYYLYPH